MALANVARRHGDDFQARLFWLKAASLLDPHSPIAKVSYETGPKSFDDVQVDYEPDRAPVDHEGQPITRWHHQCKWHTTAGVFGYQELTDPAFINASRFSLLQRAHQARSALSTNDGGYRYEFVTNWRIRAGDPLMELVRKESDALDLQRLYEGVTDRSRMGEVRKVWREHLGTDDAGLAVIARTLAIAEVPDSLASLKERLDDRFAAVGLKRIPPDRAGFLYDDLTAKLLAQGRVEFDRVSFRAMAEREGLLQSGSVPSAPPVFGIRSFMHPIDPLEERCRDVLNLVPHFEGRYIRDAGDWERVIHPKLHEFVLHAARSGDHIRFIVDAHVSLAFATGALLNVKSGKRIDIEQRSAGRHFWSINDQPADSHWPKLLFADEVVNSGLDDCAVAIGLTHDVTAGVRNFLAANGLPVGRILHCRLESGHSQQSIGCGAHAASLAESIVQRLQRARRGARSRTHIFIAGPNAFAFFLGQHQQAIGPVALYEWDFDGHRGSGYSLGLTISDTPPV